MKKSKILCLMTAFACTVSLFGGCGSNNADTNGSSSADEHEPITIESPFRDISPFLDLLNEKYPEIKINAIPYSGKNATSYLKAELRAGDMPDIYIATVYSPGQEDLSDRLYRYVQL